ncbi:MAG: hypothetical protein LC725_09310 [Lentisphaerae bacterium]|nr:hypothetical protein [Lentisphaerota bacterium]
MGWVYSLLDDDWTVPPSAALVREHGSATIKGHLGLKGISISPDGGGESLSFFVDADGRLRSVMDLVLQCEGQTRQENAWVFMKTQFLTPDMHIWIVGLLKYLQKKYFSNLEVDDEGGFWETGDRPALEAKMRLLNEKMDELVSDLQSESLGDLSGLSAEEIASRLEDFLKERQ